MSSLQNTSQNFTEQAAEQLDSESLTETVLACQQRQTTASLSKRKRGVDDIAQMKLKALEGDVDAQLFMGDHYKEEENNKESYVFYNLAANQGHPFGIYGLAIQTYNTIGDEHESFRLFMKAANLGVPEAQVQISLYFLRGDAELNLAVNLQEGFTWMEKAAYIENKVAQYYMGSMYRKGVCVEQSDRIAFRWFHRSADQGYAPAQFSLATYFESDLVGKKDMKKAYDWKLKAAHQGYIEVNGELFCPSSNPKEIMSSVDMFGGPY